MPSHIVTIILFTAALTWVSDAFSLTFQRFASVEIVDQQGGIRPADFIENAAKSQESANIASFSKDVTIQNQDISNNSKITETSINTEFLISKSPNNVQLSLQENPSKNTAIKFKSMQAISQKGNDQATAAKSNKSNETAVKLATVVTIPNNLPGGKYYLSLQFSAHYE